MPLTDLYCLTRMFFLKISATDWFILSYLNIVFFYRYLPLTLILSCQKIPQWSQRLSRRCSPMFFHRTSIFPLPVRQPYDLLSVRRLWIVFCIGKNWIICCEKEPKVLKSNRNPRESSLRRLMANMRIAQRAAAVMHQIFRQLHRLVVFKKIFIFCLYFLFFLLL